MAQVNSSTQKYQLAGIDDRERGFNRQVEISSRDTQYQAVLRYERLRVDGEPYDSEEKALLALIKTLHSRGYTQLRTQLIFRGDQYLGSQEMWVDYPDPEPVQTPHVGFLDRIRMVLGRVKDPRKLFSR